MEKMHQVKWIKGKNVNYQFINMDSYSEEQLYELIKQIKVQKELADKKIIPIVKQLKEECKRHGFSLGSISVHNVWLDPSKPRLTKRNLKSNRKDQEKYFACHLLDEHVVLFGNVETPE
jgi:sugar phosphate isomerase/epimerase